MRKISIELERLEVVFDANLEKLEAEFNKIVPMIDKTMRAMGMTVNRGSEKVDKSLDISEGLTRMEKQMQGMTAFIKRQTEMMEQQSEKSSNVTANNMIKGIAKARKAVGKDVEAMVNDINSQMNRASTKQSQIDYLKSQRQGAADKGDTKSVVRYDNQLSTAQAQLTGFEEKAKKIFNSMQQEYKNVTTQIKNSTLEMTKQKDVIAQQKARVMEVNELYNQQARKISLATAEQKRALHTKYQGQGGVFNPNHDKELDKFGYKLEDTKASAKTGAEYRKLAAQLNKVIASYNQMITTQSALASRAQVLNSGIRSTSGVLSQLSRQTETAGSGMRRFGRTTDGSRGLISRLIQSMFRFGNSSTKSLGLATMAASRFQKTFRSMSGGTDKGLARNSRGMYKLGTQIRMMFNTFIFYGLMYKGLMLVATGLWNALKANDEFANSFNQIKVNMLTAFYPIYQSVLPAINAMMKGLAMLTGQLAAFISMLFGSTYDASKQGAKGLYDKIHAMNEAGSSADKNKEKVKEMQRSLMGFDEINNLSKDKKDDSLDVAKPPSVDFDKATGSYGVPKWMIDIQNLLKDFFKPFQDAWKVQGKNVMDAWKYALGEVTGLLKTIGTTFMDVWKDGTGQLVVENILNLLATLLNMIGDIAKAFKDAWDDDGRGERVVKSIFHFINESLEALTAIGEAFREAWNDGTGQRVTSHILDILGDIFESAGNIAEAWKDAFTAPAGLSLMDSLLDTIEIFLEKVKGISGVFKEWTAEIDLEPLVESIDRIVQAINPILGHIGDGLVWFMENALAPLGSFAIEEFLPLSLDMLAGALELVGSVMDDLKPILKWFFETGIKPIFDFSLSMVSGFFEFMGNFYDAIIKLLTTDITSFSDVVDMFVQFGEDIYEGLKEGVISIGTTIGTFLKEQFYDPIVNGVKSLFGIHSPSTVFAEIGTFLMEGLYEGIKSLLSKPLEIIGTLWSDMKEGISTKTTEIFDSSKELWGKTKDTISTAATDIKGKVDEKFGGAWTATKGAWTKVSDWTSSSWGKAKKAVTDSASDIWTNTKSKWSDVTKNTSDSFGKVSKWTSENWDKSKKSVVDNAKSMWDNTRNRWSDITGNTKETWDKFSSKISNTTKKSKDDGSIRMRELRDNLKNRFGETWSSARSNFDSIYSKISVQTANASTKGSSSFRTMRSNMGDSLTGLKNTTKSVFDSIAKWATDLPNRIATGLKNGVKAIKSAASSIANGMVGIIGKAMNGVISGINWVLKAVGAGKSTLGDWKVPKYAMGTGSHPGGLAMVNDGSGSSWQEAYQTPDGRQGLFPRQKNLMVDLPKGSSVLSGPRTAKMMAGIPAYAGGIGTWFKEKWDGAKQIASDVWSYAKDPSKLLNAAVSKYVDLKGAVQPALGMAKGTVATVASGATKWVTDKFNIGHESHKNQIAQGSFSGNASIANNGVYSYLMDIAQGLMKKYGMVFTSGFRSGDPYDHGKGLAVDIALPGVVNGSPKYRQAADEAINMAGVKYVITNGMWKHKGQPWTTWPDGDHYDHVHISGNKPTAKPTNDPVSGVRSFGPSVDRWQATAANAMRMLGIYSTSNMNATMNQIRSESNGNPNAINLWDINAKNGTPSKGLLQVIDPTFRANARSPYNRNIYDPLSNILASMRYATKTYGSLSNAYKGVGYENGGWVTKDGLYRMGEGGKREMVVPVDKPSLAMERLSQVFDYMGLDWADSPLTLPESFRPASFTEPSRTFASANQNRYEGGGMQQNFETMLNNLMMAIQSIGGTTQPASNGDIVINIGGKEFGRIAVSEINKYQRQVGYNQLEI